MSIRQLNELGERLAASSTEEDKSLLLDLLGDYEQPLALVQDRLRRDLGLNPIGRLKTDKTLIEKLQRGAASLSSMQDLAGLRIVRPMTLGEQDALRDRIEGMFPGCKIVDRRARPSSGYRAVHIVVKIDSYPVEIQIRTEEQHAWANLFELYADLTDRSIRYGAIPADPEMAQEVQLFMELAEIVEMVETTVDEANRELRALYEERADRISQPRPARGTEEYRERRRDLAALIRRRNRLEAKVAQVHARRDRTMRVLATVTGRIRQRKIAASKGPE